MPPTPVVRTALWARTWLARVRRRLGPPDATLFEGALALADTAVLRTLADLGVADQLANGSQTSGEIAEACGVDADALHRTLRFAASRGFLASRRDSRFANNRVSELLRVDHPGSMRSLLLFAGADWHLDVWKHLSRGLRTDESAAQAAFGEPVFKMMEKKPRAGASFDAAMEALARRQSEVVARSFDFSGVQQLCDVGGGTGALLAAILAANEQLEGILFDLPDVIDRARVRLGGSIARIELVGGDFFSFVPQAADCYVLQSVIHDWDDESCIRILANVRAAMASDARVLVVEQVIPDRVGGEHPAKALDMEMLVLTEGGRERTGRQFRSLFHRADLRLHRAIEADLVTIFELTARSPA